MKYIILICFVILSFSSNGQTSKTKDLLNEIKGFYELDNAGNITYTRVFENLGLTEREIFDVVNSYLIYKYNDANSVIQERNAEEGRIIGKGVYPNVHSSTGLVTRNFSVVHIIRVDIKDGRCRVMLTLSDYKIVSIDMYSNVYPSQTTISSTYPFNLNGVEKNFYGQAFYYSHFAAVNTFVQLEKALRLGLNSSEPGTDW
jgi:hypothetical protein